MSEEGSLRQAAAANDVDQDILLGVVELPMHGPVVGSPNDTGADAGEKSNAVVVVPEEDILRRPFERIWITYWEVHSLTPTIFM